MYRPLRGVRPSTGLEAAILERVHKLGTYFHPITACRVLIEFSERRHGAGNRYHVRIGLTVPGDEILVKHETSQRARARSLGLAKLPRLEEPDGATQCMTCTEIRGRNDTLARQRPSACAARDGSRGTVTKEESL